MAAAAWFVFDRAKEKLADGTLDLDSHTFKMVLCDDDQALTASFAGSSTDARYADLTDELATAGGYTAGGKTLTCTWTRSSGTITFDCDDQSWTSATFSAKYAVIYSDTATNKDLLCCSDLSNGGAEVPVTAGTFAVNINASGVFTLA